MGKYREPVEIEQNILNACREPKLLSHIAADTRLNASFAKKYVDLLVGAGYLCTDGKKYWTSRAGCARAERVSQLSDIFSSNYKKVANAGF